MLFKAPRHCAARVANVTTLYLFKKFGDSSSFTASPVVGAGEARGLVKRQTRDFGRPYSPQRQACVDKAKDYVNSLSFVCVVSSSAFFAS